MIKSSHVKKKRQRKKAVTTDINLNHIIEKQQRQQQVETNSTTPQPLETIDYDDKMIELDDDDDEDDEECMILEPGQTVVSTSPIVEMSPTIDAIISSKDVPVVNCVFRDLDRRLIALLNQYKPIAIVGCVAWFTNTNILTMLANTNIQCSFIVQKEKWLSPNKYSKQSRDFHFAQKLRNAYNKLQPLCVVRDADIVPTPVRCMGLCAGKTVLKPLMHHKFIVFLRDPSITSIEPGAINHLSPIGTTDTETSSSSSSSTMSPVMNDADSLEAFAVFTGSYNLSQNATKCLENAVFIQDTTIATRYKQEWRAIYNVSESLDWKSKGTHIK